MATQHKGIMVLKAQGRGREGSQMSEVGGQMGKGSGQSGEGKGRRSEDRGQRSEGGEGYREWLNKGIDELIELAEKKDGCGIQAKLKELVPEYMPQDSVCVI